MLFDSHTHFNNEDLTSLERQALFNTVDKAVKQGKMSGAVDIGFDLTNPSFYSRDLSTYRIRSFWDMLDYEGQGDEWEEESVWTFIMISATETPSVTGSDGRSGLPMS